MGNKITYKRWITEITIVIVFSLVIQSISWAAGDIFVLAQKESLHHLSAPSHISSLSNTSNTIAMLLDTFQIVEPLKQGGDVTSLVKKKLSGGSNNSISNVRVGQDGSIYITYNEDGIPLTYRFSRETADSGYVVESTIDIPCRDGYELQVVTPRKKKEVKPAEDKHREEFRYLMILIRILKGMRISLLKETFRVHDLVSSFILFAGLTYYIGIGGTISVFLGLGALYGYRYYRAYKKKQERQEKISHPVSEQNNLNNFTQNELFIRGQYPDRYRGAIKALIDNKDLDKFGEDEFAAIATKIRGQILAEELPPLKGEALADRVYVAAVKEAYTPVLEGYFGHLGLCESDKWKGSDMSYIDPIYRRYSALTGEQIPKSVQELVIEQMLAKIVSRNINQYDPWKLEAQVTANMPSDTLTIKLEKPRSAAGDGENYTGWVEVPLYQEFLATFFPFMSGSLSQNSSYLKHLYKVANRVTPENLVHEVAEETAFWSVVLHDQLSLKLRLKLQDIDIWDAKRALFEESYLFNLFAHKDYEDLLSELDITLGFVKGLFRNSNVYSWDDVLRRLRQMVTDGGSDFVVKKSTLDQLSTGFNSARIITYEQLNSILYAMQKMEVAYVPDALEILRSNDQAGVAGINKKLNPLRKAHGTLPPAVCGAVGQIISLAERKIALLQDGHNVMADVDKVNKKIHELLSPVMFRSHFIQGLCDEKFIPPLFDKWKRAGRQTLTFPARFVNIWNVLLHIWPSKLPGRELLEKLKRGRMGQMDYVLDLMDNPDFKGDEVSDLRAGLTDEEKKELKEAGLYRYMKGSVYTGMDLSEWDKLSVVEKAKVVKGVRFFETHVRLKPKIIDFVVAGLIYLAGWAVIAFLSQYIGIFFPGFGIDKIGELTDLFAGIIVFPLILVFKQILDRFPRLQMSYPTVINILMFGLMHRFAFPALMTAVGPWVIMFFPAMYFLVILFSVLMIRPSINLGEWWINRRSINKRRTFYAQYNMDVGLSLDTLGDRFGTPSKNKVRRSIRLSVFCLAALLPFLVGFTGAVAPAVATLGGAILGGGLALGVGAFKLWKHSIKKKFEAAMGFSNFEAKPGKDPKNRAQAVYFYTVDNLYKDNIISREQWLRLRDFDSSLKLTTDEAWYRVKRILNRYYSTGFDETNPQLWTEREKTTVQMHGIREDFKYGWDAIVAEEKEKVESQKFDQFTGHFSSDPVTETKLSLFIKKIYPEEWEFFVEKLWADNWIDEAGKKKLLRSSFVDAQDAQVIIGSLVMPGEHQQYCDRGTYEDIIKEKIVHWYNMRMSVGYKALEGMKHYLEAYRLWLEYEFEDEDYMRVRDKYVSTVDNPAREDIALDIIDCIGPETERGKQLFQVYSRTGWIPLSILDPIGERPKVLAMLDEDEKTFMLYDEYYDKAVREKVQITISLMAEKTEEVEPYIQRPENAICMDWGCWGGAPTMAESSIRQNRNDGTISKYAFMGTVSNEDLDALWNELAENGYVNPIPDTSLGVVLPKARQMKSEVDLILSPQFSGSRAKIYDEFNKGGYQAQGGFNFTMSPREQVALWKAPALAIMTRYRHTLGCRHDVTQEMKAEEAVWAPNIASSLSMPNICTHLYAMYGLNPRISNVAGCLNMSEIGWTQGRQNWMGEVGTIGRYGKYWVKEVFLRDEGLIPISRPAEDTGEAFTEGRAGLEARYTQEAEFAGSKGLVLANAMTPEKKYAGDWIDIVHEVLATDMYLDGRVPLNWKYTHLTVTGTHYGMKALVLLASVVITIMAVVFFLDPAHSFWMKVAFIVFSYIARMSVNFSLVYILNKRHGSPWGFFRFIWYLISRPGLMWLFTFFIPHFSDYQMLKSLMGKYAFIPSTRTGAEHRLSWRASYLLHKETILKGAAMLPLIFGVASYHHNLFLIASMVYVVMILGWVIGPYMFSERKVVTNFRTNKLLPLLGIVFTVLAGVYSVPGYHGTIMFFAGIVFLIAFIFSFVKGKYGGATIRDNLQVGLLLFLGLMSATGAFNVVPLLLILIFANPNTRRWFVDVIIGGLVYAQTKGIIDAMRKWFGLKPVNVHFDKPKENTKESGLMKKYRKVYEQSKDLFVVALLGIAIIALSGGYQIDMILLYITLGLLALGFVGLLIRSPGKVKAFFGEFLNIVVGAVGLLLNLLIPVRIRPTIFGKFFMALVPVFFLWIFNNVNLVKDYFGIAIIPHYQLLRIIPLVIFIIIVGGQWILRKKMIFEYRKVLDGYFRYHTGYEELDMDCISSIITEKEPILKIKEDLIVEAMEAYIQETTVVQEGNVTEDPTTGKKLYNMVYKRIEDLSIQDQAQFSL